MPVQSGGTEVLRFFPASPPVLATYLRRRRANRSMLAVRYSWLSSVQSLDSVSGHHHRRGREVSGGVQLEQALGAVHSHPEQVRSRREVHRNRHVELTGGGRHVDRLTGRVRIRQVGVESEGNARLIEAIVAHSWSEPPGLIVMGPDSKARGPGHREDVLARVADAGSDHRDGHGDLLAQEVRVQKVRGQHHRTRTDRCDDGRLLVSAARVDDDGGPACEARGRAQAQGGQPRVAGAACVGRRGRCDRLARGVGVLEVREQCQGARTDRAAPTVADSWSDSPGLITITAPDTKPVVSFTVRVFWPAVLCRSWSSWRL